MAAQMDEMIVVLPVGVMDELDEMMVALSAVHWFLLSVGDMAEMDDLMVALSDVHWVE